MVCGKLLQYVRGIRSKMTVTSGTYAIITGYESVVGGRQHCKGILVN